MTYIFIWEDENEQFHYFKDNFDKNEFPEGYVDYYVEVENNKIVADSWDNGHVGASFGDIYNTSLWERHTLK